MGHRMGPTIRWRISFITILIFSLQDHKRKIDFVLVFEEDKKDVDIEIPKVKHLLCLCCFFNQLIVRNWREQSWELLLLHRLSSNFYS